MQKSYNFRNCDLFKKILLSTNSLARLLLDSWLLDSSKHRADVFKLTMLLGGKAVKMIDLFGIECNVPFIVLRLFC